MIEKLKSKLINLKAEEFDSFALELFQWQAQHISVYQAYLQHLNRDPQSIQSITDIPFLPISFFKTHQIQYGNKHQQLFKSSGTTGMQRSQHFVEDINQYEISIEKGFNQAFGNPKDYTYLALLPNYLEQGDSSLVYMVDYLMKQSKRAENGFYLNNFEALNDQLKQLQSSDKKVMLIGVTYALLDFIAEYPQQYPELTVLETGGMKGRKKEIIKEEVLDQLRKGFDIDHVHSEYGMTELLSQAYGIDNKYSFTPWMKILFRDPQDPFQLNVNSGGINVIDLANIHSCAFIETMDLGRQITTDQFEVLGRFDHADLRGCNLMVSNL